MNPISFGIYITDHEGTIVRKNVRYDKIVGGTQVIPVGLKLYESCKGRFKSSDQPLQPHDWPAMQAIATGKPVLNVAISIERLDGSFGTILESAIPIMDAWGRVSGARVIIQDITRRFQKRKFSLIHSRVAPQ